MAVISVTIIESEEQVVSGIPRTVAIETNIPAAIFYTLDGSTPTLFSNQYTSPITLPTDKANVNLSILASNGFDSSPIIIESYMTNMVDGARLPHAATTAAAQENIPGLYPFGNPPIQPNAQFLNPAEAGVTVNNPALPSTPTGFDGFGNPTGLTNQPYDLSNYGIKYPSGDFQNKPVVGMFPYNVMVESPAPPPESTEQFSNLFDPRAFVIFQDSTKENPEDPPNINRMHFSLENSERSRDGNSFYTSGLDAPPVSGNFVKSFHNPRTNMMTYYYFDSWTNKWIISTTPFNNNGPWDGNMAGVVTAGGGTGSRYVFEWLPFARRVLF